MSHREEVFEFLSQIAPRCASNAEIVSHTRIKPQQQVFQMTRSLMKEGRIKGRRVGREWILSVGHTPARQTKSDQKPKHTEHTVPKSPIGAAAFEALCRNVMAEKFGTVLRSGCVDDVPKQFDMVSEDGTIAGDAKYYTAVNGTSPPAKFATIAEYVWLLEKTKAKKKFLVFGNDRRVATWWLDRYSHLLNAVELYFLSDEGKLNRLS